MNPEELDELEAFFLSLPRPLPAGLSLTHGVKVTDPESFIRAQLAFARSGSRSAYAYTCVDRLKLWKQAYLQFAGSRN